MSSWPKQTLFIGGPLWGESKMVQCAFCFKVNIGNEVQPGLYFWRSTDPAIMDWVQLDAAPA